MADINLYWTPGNPYETGNTQRVEYKERSASSYTLLATIPGFRDSYKATGLSDNTIYNFRIGNTCNNTYSGIISAISFDCPTLSTFRDNDQIDYSFIPDNSGDIDRYILRLYKDGLFQTEESFAMPASSPATGSFMGLDGLSDYTIILSMQADEMIGQCDPLSGLPIVCVSITDINGSSNA